MRQPSLPIVSPHITKGRACWSKLAYRLSKNEIICLWANPAQASHQQDQLPAGSNGERPHAIMWKVDQWSASKCGKYRTLKVSVSQPRRMSKWYVWVDSHQNPEALCVHVSSSCLNATNINSESSPPMDDPNAVLLHPLMQDTQSWMDYQDTLTQQLDTIHLRNGAHRVIRNLSCEVHCRWISSHDRR